MKDKDDTVFTNKEDLPGVTVRLIFYLLFYFCFFGNLFLQIGSGTPFRRVPPEKIALIRITSER
jgi:hypothetical protein